MKKILTLALVLSVGITLGGCAAPGTVGSRGTISNTEAGALGGTAIGAATGAIIGHGSGHTGGGALIGAAAGALGGALLGNAKDAHEERDHAIARASYDRAQADAANAQTQAIAQAYTPADLINMSRNNISDDNIIYGLQTRGCRFDATPDNIISLRNQGVSDRVIGAMQTTGLKAPPTAPVVVAPPGPAVVYAAPPPPAGVVVVAPRPRYYYGGYYRRW
jgi:uncharacterized protein YcfJ